ncbi:MAG TPA: DNA-binding protein Alba [Nitrososphaerales archaeon]|nr:DNA-binding protein Alba [Nitrososphaerales archaeon]
MATKNSTKPPTQRSSNEDIAASQSSGVSSSGSSHEAQHQERPARTSPPNHIFVGKKPVMSYAMSAMVQLAQSGEIVLKARGMVISRAVDVAEIVTKRLGNNTFEVKNIKIDTEKIGDGDDTRNVSTIEIVVAKKQQ